MEHLVTPANQAEILALLARLLDNPRGVQNRAGALRHPAAALEAMASAALPIARHSPPGWNRP